MLMSLLYKAVASLHDCHNQGCLQQVMSSAPTGGDFDKPSGS